MAFLAHWKIGGGSGEVMDGQTAVDSAAGGSGSHSGTYKLSTSGGYILSPYGTDEYLSMNCSRYNDDGYIHTFSNLADLQGLHGEMTASLWVMKNHNYGWNDTLYLASCGNTGSTSADNFSFAISAEDPRRLRFLWHYGAKNLVSVYSANDILPVRTYPTHIAFVRYEISPGFYGVKFYVNGVLADTQNNGGAGWTAPTDGSSGVMYIGRDVSGMSDRDFHLDSLRIYDSAEEASISGIYNAELPYWEPGSYDITQSTTYYSIGSSIYEHYFMGKRSGRDNAGFFEGTNI